MTKPSSVFAALACDTRLRLLDLLNRGGGWVDARALQVGLGMPQSHVSKHLRHLLAVGLVVVHKPTSQERRTGRCYRYRITDLARDLVSRAVREHTAAAAADRRPL